MTAETVGDRILLLWRRVADTYDPRRLDPLWAYVREQVSQMRFTLAQDVMVAATISYGIAKRLANDPVKPGDDNLGWVIKRLADHPVSWLDLQKSLEILAAKWDECIDE